jgi:hypothetical protein
MSSARSFLFVSVSQKMKYDSTMTIAVAVYCSTAATDKDVSVMASK